MQRVFLIIDEFQDLFYDDHLGGKAAVILEELVREGRSFGIHVVLATQTLGGQHTLPNVVKDLIPIRIALQCSDTESRNILNDDNNAAFLLERPGEAIFNQMNGRIEGNSRFQTYWLDKRDREHLVKEVSSFAEKQCFTSDPTQVIFDGRGSIDIETNSDLIRLFNDFPPTKRNESNVVWLGGPIEIKSHTSLTFKRAFGKNLIVSGEDYTGETFLATTTSILLSLTAQNPSLFTEYIIIDLTDNETSTGYLTSLFSVLQATIKIISTQREAEQTIVDVYKTLRNRDGKGDSKGLPDLFLFILGIQNFRKLRNDSFDSDKPDTLSSKLITITQNGPELGIFTIIECDNLHNFERGLGRDGLDGFDLRVGFQMSASDSQSLFDNEKACVLGPHRGLKMDTNIQNSPEKFRPYMLPSFERINRFYGRA